MVAAVVEALIDGGRISAQSDSCARGVVPKPGFLECRDKVAAAVDGRAGRKEVRAVGERCRNGNKAVASTATSGKSIRFTAAPRRRHKDESRGRSRPRVAPSLNCPQIPLARPGRSGPCATGYRVGCQSSVHAAGQADLQAELSAPIRSRGGYRSAIGRMTPKNSEVGRLDELDASPAVPCGLQLHGESFRLSTTAVVALAARTTQPPRAGGVDCAS
jgi:hypothetical protein